jgi:hypothetical protein
MNLNFAGTHCKLALNSDPEEFHIIIIMPVSSCPQILISKVIIIYVNILELSTYM